MNQQEIKEKVKSLENNISEDVLERVVEGFKIIDTIFKSEMNSGYFFQDENEEEVEESEKNYKIFDDLPDEVLKSFIFACLEGINNPEIEGLTKKRKEVIYDLYLKRSTNATKNEIESLYKDAIEEYEILIATNCLKEADFVGTLQKIFKKKKD